MLRDLHLTMAATPDYRAPRCAGHGCSHRTVIEKRANDAIRKVATILCRHFHSSGEPAAFACPWGRTATKTRARRNRREGHFEEV